MNDKKRQVVIAVIGLLGIFAIISGVAYAWFSYTRAGTKENVISSGRVKFLYTEGTNALSLTDAMPMTDSEGMDQANYFDFKVTADTGKSLSIPYTVTIRVKDEADPTRQLSPDVVKVWLSDQSNNDLDDGLGIKYFQDTNPSTRNGNFLLAYTDNIMNPSNKYNERVVYSGLVPAESTNYIKNFRLRMWIAEDTDFSPTEENVPAYCTDSSDNTITTIGADPATIDNCTTEAGYTWHPATTIQTYPFNNKTLTVTVNVYAKGEVVSQTFSAAEVSYVNSLSTECQNDQTVECALDELTAKLN